MRRITREQLQRFTDHKEPHYLYRCYDVDGRLLYIGCTVDPRRRMVSHRASRAQASMLLTACMSRHEVDDASHRGRIAGRAAERAAIFAEQPLLNTQGRGRGSWLTHIEILRYLADRGIDRAGLVRVIPELESVTA